MPRLGADADHASDAELFLQSLLDLARGLHHLLPPVLRIHALDQNEVGFVDADDEIVLTVREQALQQLERRDVGIGRLPHEQDGARLVRDEVQLLGAHVNVAGQDVVGNDVLQKSDLVVLFLVILLGLVESDGGQRADHAAHRVVPVGEGGVIRVLTGDLQRAEIPRAEGHRLVRAVQLPGMELRKMRADQRQLTGGDDEALLVHNADRPVEIVLHLGDHILKDPAGHFASSPAICKKHQTLSFERPLSYRIFR